MIIDKEIKLITSSKVKSKLKEIGIDVEFNIEYILPIEKLWLNSNYKINVKCDICGTEKILNYNLYNKNIKKHNIYCCCNKCAWIKNKKTNLEKYGVEYYNNIEKARETNLERYGVDNPFKNEEIRKKCKETNLERYGVEDPRTLKEIKDKRINTNIKKYGVEYYSQTNEHKNRVIETCLKKYGTDSHNKVDEIKLKKVQNMLNKYGFISNSMTEESKRKLRETNRERYGVEYPMQVLEFFNKQQNNSKKVKYYNDVLYYQSSYEKHFLDYINNMNMLDIIERGFCVEYMYEDIKRMHFPDFYISKYNLIVEIKSNYIYNKYLEKNISKMNKCVEMGYNYLFIIDKNYSAFNKIINI